MSPHGRELHLRLRDYKEGDDARREECALYLAVLVSEFLERHWGCVGGVPDAVVTVPSAKRDAMKAVVDRISAFNGKHVALANQSKYKPRRFRAPYNLSGKRVLLIDDTFARGRSITAARDALERVGARVATPLVIGRHIRPEFSESHQRLMARLSEHEWQLDRCGICGPVIWEEKAP